MVDPSVTEFDAEKVQKWIKNGAQPTDTVKRLLKKKALSNDNVPWSFLRLEVEEIEGTFGVYCKIHGE